MLLTHFVEVCSQTCYTKCLTDTASVATTVNLMVPDGSAHLTDQAYREWIEQEDDRVQQSLPGNFLHSDVREI